MKKFQYKGWSTAKVPAQTAGEELERIRNKYGYLKPSLIVKEEIPEDAPLHPAFTWDDAVAAAAHREQEARNIVRAVRVVYDEEPERRVIPMYTHIPSANQREEREGEYHATMEVVSDEEMFVRAWRQLQAKLDSAARSVRELQQLADRFGIPKGPFLSKAADALDESASWISKAGH